MIAIQDSVALVTKIERNDFLNAVIDQGDLLAERVVIVKLVDRVLIDS